MKMIAYLLEPSEGEIWIRGNGELKKLTRKNKDYLLDNLGFLIENPAFYGDLSPRTILAYFAKLKGYPKDRINQRIEEVLKFFHLEAWIDKKIKTFSKGMRQKLALARAMLHEPSILLLDEPTSAMDPSSAKIVRESIFSLRSSKRAIVVCTHNLHEAEILAYRIAIIRRGKIIAHGTPEELKQKILGNPIMKVEFANPLNGRKPGLPEDVKILEYGSNWIRYEVSDPVLANPVVIEALTESGYEIVTLFQVDRSLEEVYLRVVRNDVDELEVY